MSSVEVIFYSSFSSTVTVGSNATVEADAAFHNNAVIVGARASATSSTTFGFGIYASSAKTLSNLIISFSSEGFGSTEYLIFGAPSLVYRDTDSNRLMHWSAANWGMTSSIVLNLYYQGG